MASLTGSSIASSYEQLLALPDGGLNGTTLVAITDGDSATEVGFKISTNALSMNSTNQLQFGDTGTYIHQSADGVLDLVSDTEIEINATTIDMNGTLDLSGNATFASKIGIGVDPIGTLDINISTDARGSFNSGIGEIGSGVFGLQVTNAAGSALKPMGIRAEDIRLVTGSAERMRIDSNGVVDLKAGQLKFPASPNASSDANTLDDFEKGTWTATDGSDAGLSLTIEQNTYIKVGNLVTACIIVTYPTTTNTSLARLTLPITADSTGSSAGGAVLEQNISTSQSYTACVNYSDGVIFRLRGVTSQTNADLSGKRLRFVITYHST